VPSHDAGYRNHGSPGIRRLSHRSPEPGGGVSAVPVNQYKNEISFYILFPQTFYAKNIFLKSFVLFYRYFKKFSKKND
jgi:hypothetical protein